MHTTKYFGEVEPIIDRYRGITELETTYNGQEVRLALWGCGNMENLEANLPFFWEVADKYAETPIGSMLSERAFLCG